MRRTAEPLYALWIVQGERYLAEARVSERSVHQQMPQVQSVIVNGETQLHTGWFVEATRRLIDALDQLPRDAKVLWLDSDTYVVEPIPDLFDLLDRFDLALAHAPGHRTAPTVHPVPDCFPEFNIGVIAMKNSLAVQWLWRSVYARQLAHLDVYGDNDQAPLREELWNNDELRWATLPSEYNCRFNFGCQVRDRVKILHGRANDYDAVARSINAGWVDGVQVPPRLWAMDPERPGGSIHLLNEVRYSGTNEGDHVLG